MDIKGKTILVLGGWGLVGTAVCRRLVEEEPKRIIITSLLEREAKEAVVQLQGEYPKKGRSFFVPWWGNLFLRHELKDTPRDEVMTDPTMRAKLIDDLLDEFSSKLLARSSVYQLMKSTKPDIVVDCINSATAIAYQDLFTVSRNVRQQLKRSSTDTAALVEVTERLLATQYVPQLIRHVQIMYRSMHEAGTNIYVKIGTSGTGGMGLNIPYTHSEERPSSVLLSKSAVAGAHTMLLFLMGRTPDSPITKEIKPTAAIAWKRIGFGEVRKRGRAIALVDCPPAQATKLGTTLDLKPTTASWKAKNESLRSVFIDTGENGTFSRAEFEAISTPGQMEFVTPEEIAESVAREILGGNTGHDIINALDNATLNPTYRAGFLFESALKELKALEKKHQLKSVAFEMLGPPKLSKLLYEAHLLQLAYGSMKAVMKATAKDMSAKCTALIDQGSDLRSQIISIGIPVLMPDGVTLLRGPEIKIPPFRGDLTLPIRSGSVDTWAHDGWVDLRISNMESWKSRMTRIKKDVDIIPGGDTSSQFLRTSTYWDDFETIEPGKLVGWIFSVEEHGARMKA